jgi:hypothetical protein
MQVLVAKLSLRCRYAIVRLCSLLSILHQLVLRNRSSEIRLWTRHLLFI